jgi:hypothetical protein
MGLNYKFYTCFYDRNGAKIAGIFIIKFNENLIWPQNRITEELHAKNTTRRSLFV